MAVSSSVKLPKYGVDAVLIKVKGSASYTTGGDALAANTIPEGNSFLGIAAGAALSGARTYVWDNDAQKLKAFDAFATQEGAATDCSADEIYLLGIIV